VSRSRRHGKRKPLFQRRSAPGTAPGSLVADPQALKPYVRLMAYDQEKCVERELQTAADFESLRDVIQKYPVAWISVEGVGDVDMIRRLGEILKLHELALEDVMNNHQRAKVEQYGEHLFIVARIIEEVDQPGCGKLESDQLGMFLGQRLLVTFEHTRENCFDPIRDRIRRGKGIIRTSGPDYLAYALLDSVVDSYFPILEGIGEQIEALEERIIESTKNHVISRIHDVKTQLLQMRRVLWPLREALHVLIRDPNPLVQEGTRVYLRDCADHSFQIIDLVESYRELAGDLLDLYHSSVANRTNEVMKVLTVIATIFIPLTFIVGVYGMNFDMPEFHWRWSYPLVWVVILATAGSMIYYFWRKGWLFAMSTQDNAGADEMPI
jgi:magnesium transporter